MTIDVNLSLEQETHHATTIWIDPILPACTPHRSDPAPHAGARLQSTVYGPLPWCLEVFCLFHVTGIGQRNIFCPSRRTVPRQSWHYGADFIRPEFSSMPHPGVHADAD